MRIVLVAMIGLLAQAASAQESDCAAQLLGQVGCGQGMRPYVTQMGDTLGDRGNGWYTSDPDPNDDVYGAYPYTDTLGGTTESASRSYSSTFGTGCNPLLAGDCN